MTLTDRIAADLRQRLAADAAVDLRLVALAQSYEVSTQPVRLALAQLKREGVLKRAKGRGFHPTEKSSRSRKKLAALPPAAKTADALHHQLATFAVRLSLRGEETFLREESTADRLGVSRAQAREALQRLHGEGIVEHVPRRGWRVRPFSRDDLDDFLEVREVLETRALTLAWSKLERRDLEAFFAGNDPREARPDNRLHDYWIQRSENRYIQRFFAQHAPFFSALFNWEDYDEAAARQSCVQHRAILRAILAGDRDAAIAALVSHIHDNHPVLSRWPDQPATS